MQTFRECRRGFTIPFGSGPFTCAEPLAFADPVLLMRAGAGLDQAPGLQRAVMFGGLHGQLEYTMQLVPGDDELPCFDVYTVHTALMVLPLTEGSEVVPAYIPNIAESRSQLSVIVGTQSDSDDRYLYYRMDNFWWTNTEPDACGNTDAAQTLDISILQNTLMANSFRQSNTMFQVKSRARIDERHGLFLVRNVVTGTGVVDAVLALVAWSNFRFAVRASR